MKKTFCDRCKRETAANWALTTPGIRSLDRNTASYDLCAACMDNLFIFLEAHDAAKNGLRRLRMVLEKVCAAAESWHRETGHDDDDPIIQCDAICACIPEIRAVLDEFQK